VGVLSWVVVGFVAGVLAKAITGVRGTGCLTTIAIGIVGGLLGGVIFRAAGDEGITGFGWRALLVASIGATVLLFLYGVIAGRNRDRYPEG
jgi:uncharacterized membrane protein YeaQ/YmgE (transglycosylase-associated protein family)